MPYGLRHGFVRSVVVATIPDEDSISGDVHLNGLTIAALVVPSGWVAADITFQGSVDGTNWFDVYGSGSDTELTVQAAASRYICVLDPESFDLKGIQRVRVRSGTSGVPVTQTAGPIDVQLVLID